MRHIVLQEKIELSPVPSARTYELFEAHARILDRPNFARLDNMRDANSAPALLGIGLEQIVNLCRIGSVAHRRDPLGLAAHEHVAPQPLARHQPCRRIAHGIKPHQTER